ncbi:hypothetical protein LCGC14_0909420 [marine sediment metagenome]|uniref:Uncharacterized protein n=1 Tax=marine sediment metagenome TaxID=412755 RepID=A0A0F9NU58_9ZZZZ
MKLRIPVSATVSWWRRPGSRWVQHDLVELPSMMAGMRWPETPDDIVMERMYPPDQLYCIARYCVDKLEGRFGWHRATS